MSFKDFLNQNNVHESIISLINEQSPIFKTDLSFLESIFQILKTSSQDKLESIMKQTKSKTIERFGRTISFYVPLYLSNECDSDCVYCGFSQRKQFERISLNTEDIEKNFDILKNKGFDSILLLTGESPSNYGVHKIAKAILLAKNYFSNVSIEVFPMTIDEYKIMLDAGASGLTIYQETYHQNTYKKMHLKGQKADYNFRLNAPERALKAGFRKVGLGFLLGLYDHLYDSLMLAAHLHYLQKTYWRAEYTLSFPRIRLENILSKIPYPVQDIELIKLICAMRLHFFDLGLILSTRENSFLRDHLIGYGITTMSAESKTNPGGYIKNDSQEQFHVEDQRTLNELLKTIQKKGFDPILKDWQDIFQPTQ